MLLKIAGFNFRNFCEFNQSIFQMRFLILSETPQHKLGHGLKESGHRLNFLSFSYLDKVRSSLKSSKADVEIGVSKSSLENAVEGSSVLVQFINNEREQSVVNVESGFQLSSIISLDHSVKELEEVVPYLVLDLVHSASDNNSEFGDFSHQASIDDALDKLQSGCCNVSSGLC